VFLHVITYNTSAMSLYSRQGFRCVATLRAFYYIATGRTPDPNQQVGCEGEGCCCQRMSCCSAVQQVVYKRQEPCKTTMPDTHGP
jgi:hypothetical protein